MMVKNFIFLFKLRQKSKITVNSVKLYPDKKNPQVGSANFILNSPKSFEVLK